MKIQLINKQISWLNSNGLNNIRVIVIFATMKNQHQQGDNSIQCQHTGTISSIKYKTGDFYFYPSTKYQNTIVFPIPDNILPTIILPNISNLYSLKITLRKQPFSKEIPLILTKN
ncbi:hypothetical protein DICPUDRAFT_95748 [Dictyostelium purpureum]|uniref:Uncharacterized protein n=1 Tax=Dictyostelium purpureum TaxID=5786 RepID=F1A089_DICPU|nr:uncharacterized protein DICPUDRAFT_95748 [Dictyostelium purpureum]EGC30392.1 hypothetical protein DICPUDRAFT_95748 [Dictyostelium purpureum]|eukprot:XP_003293089.1 hypothetical protein DICPUDRAFT_95748 [Dictyostelium purpureum]